MKILLAAYWALPQPGGVWSYVQGLYESLIKRGHEVDILSHHPDETKYHIVYDGRSLNKKKITDSISKALSPLYHSGHKDVDSISRFETERYSFEAAAAFFDLHKYDLIHTQDVISTRAISRVKPVNTPLVSTIHGCHTLEYLLHVKKADMNSNLQHLKQSFISRYLAVQEGVGASSSNITIVPSLWLKNLLTHEYNVPDERLTVIPYGIDINQLLKKMEAHTQNPPPSSTFIIGCIARLDRVKGHKYLLEALAKLKQDRNDWVCWLIGGGSLRRELTLLAKHLGIAQHVIFLGARDDVPALLKQLNVFVLPSLQDNHPFALMEAQIAGKPVVVTDAGGMPEMVTHKKTGLISPKGNSELLYQNIKSVLENKSLRKSLAASAKKYALNNWSIDKMTKQTLTIYRELID